MASDFLGRSMRPTTPTRSAASRTAAVTNRSPQNQSVLSDVGRGGLISMKRINGRGMAQGAGRDCIFCRNKADSQEHIWSQWILDLLPEGKDGTFVKRFPDGKQKSWRTSKPELTVGLVCERCNNGWMSAELEGPMKNATEDILILNNRKSFSARQCASVAAWAFKTTLLANHSNPLTTPMFSAEQRQAF